MNILEIKNARDLFKKFNEDDIKKEYRRLSKKYHPDLSGKDTNEIFMHITTLYGNALKQFGSTFYVDEQEVLFKDHIKNKTYRIKYYHRVKNDICEIFYGNTFVFYLISKDKENAYNNFIKNINFLSTLKTKSDKFDKIFPQDILKFKLDDHFAIMVKKHVDFIPLNLIYEYYDKTIDPKHTAWIISRLLNMCGHLRYVNMTNNNISLNSLLVDPLNHNIILTDWFFALPMGVKYKYLTNRVYNLISDKKIKKSYYGLDEECVKEIGRVLSNNFKMGTNVPTPLKLYLLKPHGEDIYKTIDDWKNKILIDSFGKKKYTLMDINLDKILIKLKMR